MIKILMMLLCSAMLFTGNLFNIIDEVYAVELPVCTCKKEYVNKDGIDYFEIYVEAEKTLIVTLEDVGNSPSYHTNELYIKYGSLPTFEDYDDNGTIPNKADQAVAVYGTKEGYYYVLVHAVYHDTNYKICVNIQGECACVDKDNDGYGISTSFECKYSGLDCNDSDVSINPGAKEVCNDNKDNDCDGTVDDGCAVCTDSDKDGYYTEASCEGEQDCNDNDNSINPGATEVCNDNKDNDCDGTVDDGCSQICTDKDGDSYYAEEECEGEKDCNDSDPGINPGAVEVCSDGKDNDCDNTVDENCSPPAPPDITDGLVAYYPFNGNANDASGNGHHGTVYGATLTYDRCENNNQAYNVINDQYISVSPNLLNNLNDFSISCWVKFNDINTDVNMIIGFANSTEDNEFNFYYDSPNNFGVDLKGKTYMDFSGVVSVEDNNWHFVVCVRKDILCTLYVDNKNIGQITLPSGNGITATSAIIGQDHDCVKGCFETHQNLSGNIDQLRIYKRVLSEAEIQQLYAEECTCIDNDTDGYFAEAGCGAEVDCDDTDPTINPGIETDTYGDLIDNDCDGETDEDQPFCSVLLVSPDEFFIGFGLLPRLKMVRIIGAGPDFDSQGDIVFSSDDVIVLASEVVSKTEISALVYIAPMAEIGSFDVSIGDCVGKDLFDIKRWRWQ